MYMARARPCTQCVLRRGRPYTWAVNMAVYSVHDRVHGRVPVHGRVQCTRAVNTAVYRYTTVYTVVYTVHGRVYGSCTLYTAVFTARVQGRPCTGYMTRAVYRLCTRPCTGHVHGPAMTRTRPCTGVHPVHGRVYGPCTQPCTDRERRCV